MQVPGLVLLTIAEGLGRFVLLQLFHFPAPFGELMLHVILPQALYNGLLGALVLAGRGEPRAACGGGRGTELAAASQSSRGLAPPRPRAGR